MKIVDTALLLSALGLAVALDQPDSYIRRAQHSEDRELLFAGMCSRQLAVCQAEVGDKGLPLDKWEKSISNPDLLEIVDSLRDVDFVRAASDLHDVPAEEAASALEALQPLAATVAGLSVSQPFEIVIKVVVGTLGVVIKSAVGPILGLDLHPLSKGLTYLSKFLFAGPDGWFGLTRVAITMGVDFLGWTIGKFVDIIVNRGEANLEYDECVGQLMQCKHDKLMMTFVPSLVGATFLEESMNV